MPAVLIRVGSWFFWQYSFSEDLIEVLVELAPYAKNRGRRLKFDLVPFEEWHLDL